MSNRTFKLGHDGNLKFFTLSCVCQGKAKSKTPNALKQKPEKNLEFKAKIKATCCPNGRFTLYITLSIVVLNHNHTLSLGKARYFICHKKMDAWI